MTDERPKMNLKQTKADRLIEITGWVLVVVLWGLAISAYPTLPETIPTHFNATGEVDGSGPKDMIWIAPIIGSLLFISLTILNNYPHVFNYPVSINAQNAYAQYKSATTMIRFLKLSLILVFLILFNYTIKTATGEIDELGSWFLPLSLALIFIPLLVYIIVSFQRDK
jgi:uncharacterized membrane protein